MSYFKAKIWDNEPDFDSQQSPLQEPNWIYTHETIEDCFDELVRWRKEHPATGDGQYYEITEHSDFNSPIVYVIAIGYLNLLAYVG